MRKLYSKQNSAKYQLRWDKKMIMVIVLRVVQLSVCLHLFPQFSAITKPNSQPFPKLLKYDLVCWKLVSRAVLFRLFISIHLSEVFLFFFFCFSIFYGSVEASDRRKWVKQEPNKRTQVERTQWRSHNADVWSGRSCDAHFLERKIRGACFWIIPSEKISGRERVSRIVKVR